MVDFEEGLHDLAFVEFGVGQAPYDRHVFDGGDQVGAQAPEVAGVGGAVAVAGVAGQVRVFGGGRDRVRSTGVESISRSCRTLLLWAAGSPSGDQQVGILVLTGKADGPRERVGFAIAWGCR